MYRTRRETYTSNTHGFEGHRVVVKTGYHRSIVISDSMFRECHLPKHSDLSAVSGADIETLGRWIDQGNIPLREYELVILHVGTNDIGNRNENGFSRRYSDLINLIRHFNPSIHIKITGLLPRLIDYQRTYETTRHLNYNLKAYAEEFKHTKNLSFYPTYLYFVAHGAPQAHFWKSDRIHLNDTGIRKMNRLLKDIVFNHFNQFNRRR